MQTRVKIISEQRPMADAGRQLLSRAWQLYGDGHLANANRWCDQLLEDHPDDPEVIHLKALILWGLRHQSQAISLLQRAAELQPEQPRHFNNLGVFLNKTGLYNRAEACFKTAVKLSPHYYDARSNLGLAWYYQGKLEAAAQCFRAVLSDCPTPGPVYANLGMALLAQGDNSGAAKAYEHALASTPEQPQWWGNLGAALLAKGDFTQAVRAFQQAVNFDPANADYMSHLGVALRALGDYAGSISILQKALAISPDHPDILSDLCVALQQTCQWQQLPPLLQRLHNQTQNALSRGERPAEQPMFNIWRSSDPHLNGSVARSWSRYAENRALRSGNRYRHKEALYSDRLIHVGYISHDFRNHPVAHQMLPLFGLHNRNRFHISAFSLGPDDASVYHRQIQHDCDQFIDISTLSTQQAAQCIHDNNVDILVDLMGHSNHNRLQILALCPAPIQVAYLGFLASTGADFIDYLIADETVVPSGQDTYYSEKIIYMPRCYQINHNLFFPAQRKGSCEDHGLPSDRFVFCCFNSSYKINAPVFDTWIEILKQVPHSVLWLYNDNPMATQQLSALAAQKGIDSHRLFFADKVPLADHLHRLQFADLALDTDGYNGGATTANALWAGVPVVTIIGNHWVSRMSASHLIAAGFPDLVTSDRASYTKKVLDLARNPKKLECLRSELNCRRKTNALFDASTFVRDLESGFEAIWQRHCNGLTPAHVRVLPMQVHHG